MSTQRPFNLFSAPLVWTILFLTASLGALAQPNVKMGLYPVSGLDELEVRILPDAAWNAGDGMWDAFVTVRYENNAGITLGAATLVPGFWPAGHATPTLDQVNTDGGYTYVTYAITGNTEPLDLATQWAASVERPFFRIAYTNSSSSCLTAIATDDLYQLNNNLEWYMSLFTAVPFGITGDVSDGYIPGDAYPVKNTTTGELFCSIQSAIDDSQTLNGHVITVAAGTYTENVNVNKGVDLRGANYGVDPNTGSRVSESILNGTFSLQSNGIGVNGFEVTGAGAAFAAGGAGPWSNVSLTHNRMIGKTGQQTIAYGFALGAVTTSIGATNWIVSNNRIANIQAASATAMALFNISGLTVSDNHILHTNATFTGRRGINADGVQGATISGNSIDMGDASPTTTTNAPWAIQVSMSDRNASGFSITGNTISGCYRAVQSLSQRDLTGLSVLGNQFTNVSLGIDLNTGGVAPLIPQPVQSNISIDNNIIATVTPTAPGALGAAVRLRNLHCPTPGCSAVPASPNGPVSFTNVDINDNVFSGTNPAYLLLESGISTPTTVNATCNYFGTTDPLVVSSRISGVVSFLPFDNNGTDSSPSIGYQPAPAACSGIGPVVNTNTGLSYVQIQAAINDPLTLNNHTITVAAGTYAENVLLDKQLDIRGPNYGISPNGGTRVAEAIIVPSFNDPDPYSPTSSAIFYLEPAASGSSLQGFTIDGDNPSISGGLAMNGADVNGIEALAAYEGLSNLTFQHNIVQNLSYAGLDLYNFYNGGAATSGNLVNANKFDNIVPTVFGMGVLIYNNCYTSITNNVMTRTRIGVQTGNFHQADPGNSHAISNNSIAFGELGIWNNLSYQSASSYVIQSNTLTTANSTTASGLFISSLADAAGVTVLGNTVSGAFAGIELWNNPTTSTVTITGGSVTNCVNGMFANNYDGYTSNADPSAYVINGVSIIGGTNAVYVKDNDLNTNGATVSVTLVGGVTVNGTTTGLRIEGAGASANFSGAGAASFFGSTTYIEEVSNSIDKPATAIDATAVNFGGVTGVTATNAQLFAIEDKIFHRIDDGATGLVTVKASHLHVTDIATATATNNDYTRLRNAMASVGSNWTVLLNGTFDWVEANAAASWALGNDGLDQAQDWWEVIVYNQSDDYALVLPYGLTGVTVTATAPGAAIIQGPGDISTHDGETCFALWGPGGYQNWTISNLTIQDFDESLMMFFNSASNEFNNLSVANNTFRVPADLNPLDFPADGSQNIAIHLSFGSNQSVSGNSIELIGNGASNGTSYSSMVGLQSNTSGGAVYNGLQITGNTITVTGTLNAQPSTVLGIWENAHGHASTITVSNNSFTNLTGANADINLMRAFRVTSHSGASSTVTYSGNTASGANVGMQWLAGQNFAGQLPVQVSANTFTGCATGVLVQSDGSATVTNNFFVNPATSSTAVQAMALGAAGATNTIAATDNSLLNNGNALGKLALNPGTGSITATCNWWGSNGLGAITPLIGGSVSYIPFLTSGLDSNPAIGFQPVPGSCGGYPVINTTTSLGYMTIQAGHDDPLTLNSHTLAIDAWTFNERVSLSKSLTLDGSGMTTTILDGTGLAGTGSGISIASGVTGVTIRDLAVRNYALGTSNDAGIAAQLSNNNLSILNCEVYNNINTPGGRGGVYVNGPVSNVLIDNVKSHDHPSGARGIVVWNGLKSNITITNCEVYNNNCCGIELSDGTASGVTMTGNNVHDNADNGMGLVGLGGTVGANLIANNTLTNNGRFGMEVKMPGGNGAVSGTGSVVVENNTVTLVASPAMNVRDHAGIAVFRRGMLTGNTENNVDIPTGVVVRGNTVSGYKQLNPGSLNSEGFGIVIEGVDHTVSNNTLTNNDIGLQLQGGGHNAPNYVENSSPDGDQADGQSPNYFGRGNAPYVCNVSVSGNTFSSNGTDEQVVTGAGILAPASASNQKAKRVDLLGTTYCTIQKAVDKATAGQTATVHTATYDEQVLVNKSMTIDGTSPKPTVDFTGTVSGKATLFDVSADAVTINDMRFNVDLSKLSSAIIASGATIDNVVVTNNVIDAYGTPPPNTAPNIRYGDRNAVSVNYGGFTNYRVATAGVNSVTFTGNTVNGTLPSSFFRSGISADEVGGTFSYNTLQTINQDILVRFGSNGNILVDNNNLNGGGLQISDPNAGGGPIAVSNNTFNGTFGNTYTNMLRLKNNYTGLSATVSGNTFTNTVWAASLENFRNVAVTNNTFTPLAGSTTYRHLVVNTKEISSSSGFYAPNVDLLLQGNTFNGSGTPGGTGVAFYNHDNDSPVFGTFTFGGPGALANSFNSGIGTFVRLDNSIGNTLPAPPAFPEYASAANTVMACWTPDIEISENLFDVGSGLQSPGSMNALAYASFQAALFDKQDDACLGKLTALRLRLDVAALLEGPYSGGGLMADELRAGTLPVSYPLIPTAHPYTGAPWSYTGTETTTGAVLAVSGTNAIVDWVLLELRNAATPATIIARRAALVQRDGDIVDTDGVSPVSFLDLPNGSYHVAVRHRNHLGMMTLTAPSLSPVTTTIDFTNPGTATYGTAAQKNVSGVNVMWTGNSRPDDRLKYTGPNNDRDPILVIVGGTTPTNSVNGYLVQDNTMDGKVKYTGPDNDRDPILVNILPGPVTGFRLQQLP